MSEDFEKRWNELPQVERDLIDKWIKEMQQKGYTYDKMLHVFQTARRIHNNAVVRFQLLNKKTLCKN